MGQRLLGLFGIGGCVVIACGGKAVSENNPSSTTPTATSDAGHDEDGGATTTTTNPDPNAHCAGVATCACGTAVCVGDLWQCVNCPPPFPNATEFCSGKVPHASVNGTDVPVSYVTGKAFALSCCDSAEAIVSVPDLMTSVYLRWRTPARGQVPINLEHPPAGFSIELDVACDPAGGGCADLERYVGTFHGSLQYAPTDSGLTTGYCLSTSEATGNPNATVHSFQLYVPSLASPF